MDSNPRVESQNALSSAARTSDDERRLRLIIEATPNTMVMGDATGGVVLVNSQTELLFGYSRDELLSLSVEQLLPERFRERHHLEITEGILMESPREVIKVMDALRDLGIVVDDFGTGFSSLAYLTRSPIDKIKIDRSFVRDVTVDHADAAIVDTIIVMAHTLGVTVVAEGIETATQEHYLRERGCDKAQGFRYAAGTPADRFLTVIGSIDSG